ncbi:MAG: cytochrome c family protein [Planctomycetes bacterium]|nr:cytochrome c family protein [Planctomycetota bacterium]
MKLVLSLVLSAFVASSWAAFDGFEGLKAPAPTPDGRAARLAEVEKIECAACHKDVAEEWATTLHALAWVDELYKEELAEKKKPEGCWGCHAPVPLHGVDLAQKPPPRDGARELGVTCESCHLAPDGSILGPFGAATDAHRSTKHADFGGASRDALCAACHRTNIGPVLGVAKDFEASGQAAKGRSCVGCHMAAIERPIANTKPGEPAREFEKRAGRSHALQTPRDPSFLARAFACTAKRDGARTQVEIRNVAGHRVPGVIGRSLVITAEVLGADGRVLAKKKVEIDYRSFLPVEEALTLDLDAIGPKVRLTGLHEDPRLEKPVEFLALELDIAGAH